MSDSMREPRTRTPEDDLRHAVACLYLAVDASVAKSVGEKAEAVLAALSKARDERDGLARLASLLLVMAERVEWVRRSGGKLYACPFCGGVSERDGGLGHTEECEWILATTHGNELRLAKVLQ